MVVIRRHRRLGTHENGLRGCLFFFFDVGFGFGFGFGGLGLSRLTLIYIVFFDREASVWQFRKKRRHTKPGRLSLRCTLRWIGEVGVGLFAQPARKFSLMPFKRL